jgi:hypothetical protein
MILGFTPCGHTGGIVAALPSSILEPLWVQVSALPPTRQVHHPLGCTVGASPTGSSSTSSSSKTPCGGQVPGPSPVDRRKQGLKRSAVTEAQGIPLGWVPAPASRRDDGLLAATLDTLAVVGVLPRGQWCT